MLESGWLANAASCLTSTKQRPYTNAFACACNGRSESRANDDVRADEETRGEESARRLCRPFEFVCPGKQAGEIPWNPTSFMASK
jgi:hypothetical protein